MYATAGRRTFFITAILPIISKTVKSTSLVETLIGASYIATYCCHVIFLQLYLNLPIVAAISVYSAIDDFCSSLKRFGTHDHLPLNYHPNNIYGLVKVAFINLSDFTCAISTSIGYLLFWYIVGSVLTYAAFTNSMITNYGWGLQTCNFFINMAAFFFFLVASALADAEVS